MREALLLKHNYIGTEHILLGLIREGEGVAAQILERMGADLSRVRDQVIMLLHGQVYTPPVASQTVALAPRSGLDDLGRNLTEAARAGKLDPVVSREKEIERVMHVLSRRVKNCPLLVGEQGVGKTAVIEGLAQLIAKGEVPQPLRDKRIYLLDLGAAILGARGVDEQTWQERILAEVAGRDDVILLIDDIHVVVGGAAADGAHEATAVIKHLLGRRGLPLIATATPAGYHDRVETDAVFERSFQPIQITEPTPAHTVEILKGLRDRYEAHHRVTISDAAVEAAARLASQSLPGRHLPSKAIDLMDEASSILRMRTAVPPPDLRDFDEKIADVRRDKESAIDAQDFEKASALRDTEKQLIAKKDAKEKAWQAGDMDTVAEVTEDLVAETLAIMSGSATPGAAAAQPPQPKGPAFPPAGATSEDREIWAMA